MSWFGIPRLVLVLAENQRGIAEELCRAGCCVSAGWYESLSAEDIYQQLAGLLRGDLAAMHLANRTLVDGRGVERIAERILAIGHQKLTAVG